MKMQHNTQDSTLKVREKTHLEAIEAKWGLSKTDDTRGKLSHINLSINTQEFG